MVSDPLESGFYWKYCGVPTAKPYPAAPLPAPESRGGERDVFRKLKKLPSSPKRKYTITAVDATWRQDNRHSVKAATP